MEERRREGGRPPSFLPSYSPSSLAITHSATRRRQRRSHWVFILHEAKREERARRGGGGTRADGCQLLRYSHNTPTKERLFLALLGKKPYYNMLRRSFSPPLYFLVRMGKPNGGKYRKKQEERETVRGQKGNRVRREGGGAGLFNKLWW